ncbi:MAG: tRNA uridine-5-carboxymethylaminomethyl(34) synthesis GTPase MnmE [Treponema sp.]|jgi:tRNA modification GTPase|nr:tRNA uridine-5-carboxymethylaminomethyl(34) synthesis GTPase MnmE [Treponema sp.]
MEFSYGDDSPIAAYATAPGKSALTLIRCSGKGSLELAAGIFSAPEKIPQAAGNTVLHGWIVTPNKTRDRPHERADEVLISVFRSPKSYTGEDSLDISCHGGNAAGQAVMAALRAAGFRDALPGEFTFRAFMNGKLDLTRAESVMELVSARTDRGRRNAINRLSGVLEKEISAIKKTLVEVLSGAEIFLDYSEDEISAVAEEIAGRLPNETLAREALTRLQKLGKTWRMERLYQEGILAVIAGRPNSGKSSLFNLLLKEERSIVTEIPGTTRDWIEAWVSIEGIPVRLADTAGIRDDSSDPVEKIGVERSRDLLEAADLVLYLIDGEAGITDEDVVLIDRLAMPHLVIWNKADISSAKADAPVLTGKRLPAISAKTGEGIAELSSAIAAAIQTKITANAEDTDPAASPSLGTVRQKNLVEAAVTALEEALNMAEKGEPLDLVSPLIREAVNSLGEITGEVSTADILEEMFSKFCVGK